MRKFILRTLLFSLPVLAVVAVVNYYVDPANIFSDKGLELRAAEMMLRGENVVGLTNYDERLLQRELVERLLYEPQTIVLGSSRGMLVNSRNMADSSLINNCVSGARLEDMMAVWGLYEENGWRPQRVILEISPYMFNEHYDDTRYKTNEADYHMVKAKLNFNDAGKSEPGAWLDDFKCLELISLSYFQSSLNSWLAGRSKDDINSTQDTVCMDQNLKFSDGSIAYSLNYRSRGVTPQDILESINYGKGAKFLRLSDERRQLFEAFVDYLTRQGMDVIVFLAPMPQEVMAKKSVFSDVENYLRHLIHAKDLSILGSYHAESYGASLIDFYDGMHPSVEVYDTILTGQK